MRILNIRILKIVSKHAGMTLEPSLFAKLMGGFRSCSLRPWCRYRAAQQGLSGAEVFAAMAILKHSTKEMKGCGDKISWVLSEQDLGTVSHQEKRNKGRAAPAVLALPWLSWLALDPWSCAQREIPILQTCTENFWRCPVFLQCWGYLEKLFDLHLPIVWVYQNKWERH